MARKARHKSPTQFWLALAAVISATIGVGFHLFAYCFGVTMPHEFPFLRPFEHIRVWHLNGGALMLLVLTVQYLRLLFGAAFLEYDRSFNEAREKTADKHRKDRVQNVLTFLVIVSNGLFALLVRSSLYGVVVLLVVQVLIIIASNKVFWREYYFEDEQREANRLIGVGDFLFILFGIWMLTSYCLETIHPWRFGSCELVLPVFLGAYSAILFGELFAYYIQAIVAALRAPVGDAASNSKAHG